MQKVELLPLVDRRPSLFDLWGRYRFHSGMLAIKAKVPPGTVQAMLCNQPISREYAQKILAALSELVHQEYTFQSVYVALIAEEEEVHGTAETSPQGKRSASPGYL